MICRNCNSEIGNRAECNFCGYNPAKDDVNGALNSANTQSVPPVQITLRKGSNGLATAGCILSFIAYDPITWTLSFIFNIIGFKNSKSKRCGRKRSIIGLILNTISFLILSFFVFIIIKEAMNPGWIEATLGGVS